MPFNLNYTDVGVMIFGNSSNVWVKLRSIIPADINMMALTATATRKLQLEVCQVLGIKDPIVIEVSPEKSNVFLALGEFSSMVETFGPIAEKLKVEHVNMGRAIIFCKKVNSMLSDLFIFQVLFAKQLYRTTQ